MGNEKFHLVGQNASIPQYEILPQARYIRCIQQRHVCLFRGAVALAVVARSTGGDDIHPSVDTFLGKRDDVLACQVVFVEMLTAVGTHVAVPVEQLAIGQTRAEIERVDIGHTTGADDAVNADDGLQARYRVMAAVEHSYFAARLPAHIV